jgi:hypothetical protein
VLLGRLDVPDIFLIKLEGYYYSRLKSSWQEAVHLNIKHNTLLVQFDYLVFRLLMNSKQKNGLIKQAYARGTKKTKFRKSLSNQFMKFHRCDSGEYRSKEDAPGLSYYR